jgi:hypothetical protein
MKQFIIILLFPVYAFTQEIPDTCFTEQQIFDISNTLDSLYHVDSLNTEIITQQDAIIFDLEKIIRLDSLQIEYQQQQIALLKSNIDLYVEREKINKPKWYKHPAIWFITGIGTTALTSKFIIEVIQ